MKFTASITAICAVSISLVSAQIDKFPGCALDCISQLGAIAQCGETDYKCICASQEFGYGFDPCVVNFCPNPDSNSLTEAVIGLCVGVGVAVTVTVQAPTATPTPPPELAKFPGCAYDCVTQLDAIAGCKVTDYNCFCKSNAFLAGFGPCISQLCDPKDYQDTSDAAEALCASNGVTVTVTATAPPETKTSGPGTSTAKTSEPENTTAPGKTPTAAGTSEPAKSSTAGGTSTEAESSGPAETSAPAEISGPAGTTSGPVETSEPTGTTAPADKSIPTTQVTMTSIVTTAPAGNGTVTGGGSTPTTNAGSHQTAAFGVVGAGLLVIIGLFNIGEYLA
ncbi:hypothetical protein H072_7871 [Dactylellina haptotyla CBS 200.50]|uniref:CFEM domain-containing protein n=1 Tax=Dactylellina haptotyla (strain CBS 200.50) TaxID=1284197 RepID=S8A6F7_DACHA|nr:hypothetical protein H072_7871 [Dactylellina haptotyla CBS 200.50]